MLHPRLVGRIFESANIMRWNDHVKPIDFTEQDKQAHKLMIAWTLGKTSEDRGIAVDWQALIEGSMFEFLQRVVLTDLKPPVYHRMMAEKGDQINAWVLDKLFEETSGIPGGFFERFRKYLTDDSFSAAEKRILSAAHHLATWWEFRIINHASPFVHGIERTRQEIDQQITAHRDVPGAEDILGETNLSGFISMCGQLRFQKRWAQTPRLPSTSVLGHLLTTCHLAFLFAAHHGFTGRRLYNNVFAALFHDLPEVLTKDIVSPIKHSVEGLSDIIKEYERSQMDERLMPLLPSSWHDEMRYFTEDEFENKMIRNGVVETGITEDDLDTCPDESCQPLDGRLLKVCDNLSAFIEADMSITYGIRSAILLDARDRLLADYAGLTLRDIDLGALFRLFHTSG